MSSDEEDVFLHPIFNWVGSKKRYVDRLIELFPQSYDPDKNVYFEPFLGSGAMLLALLPKKAIVGDIDKNVIETFTNVKTSVESVVKCIQTLYANKKGSRDSYVDSCYNFEKFNGPKKSACFIFISKHSFGSNMIYNKERTGFTLCYRNETIKTDYENMLNVALYLNTNRVKFMNASFEKVVQSAKAGDFIFMDPPYLTTRITQKKYYHEEENSLTLDKLVKVVLELHNRGCLIMLINSKSKELVDKLPGFTCKSFKAHETILGAHGKKAANKRSEGIYINYKI